MEELKNEYQNAVEKYLIKKYAIDILDRKFAESKLKYNPIDNKAEIKFFRLLNEVNVSKLTEDEMAYFSRIKKEEKWEKIVSFCETTYQKTVLVNKDSNSLHEFFPSIHGEGFLPGNSIAFCLCEEPTKKEDFELMTKKISLFESVKKQYEAIPMEEEPIRLFYR